MADPVLIEIRPSEGQWQMTRDGQPVQRFGHADDAVHQAVRLARDLIHTGEPAEVRLDSGEGRTIDVDLSEPGRVATPGEDERSAVVPGRGPDA